MSRDGKHAGKDRSHVSGLTLPQLVAGWPTVTSAENCGDLDKKAARLRAAKEKWGKKTGNGFGQSIAEICSGWGTPRATDGSHGGPNQDDPSALPVQAAKTGTSLSGSHAETEKQGALNPELPRWLMGYETEWDACAPMAMPLSRRLRRSS